MKSYLESPFAVLGLPADVSPRDIKRRVEQLTVEAVLYGRDDGSVRTAAAALEDATVRLPAEVFWLWEPAPEPIAALRSGDPRRIEAALSSVAAETTGDAIAQHDAAVLAHALALHAGDVSDAERAELWRRAFERWLPVLSGGTLTARLRARAGALDDLRLTSERVDGVQAGVVPALVADLVPLAKDDLEAGNLDGCLRWCRVMCALEPADWPAVDAAIEDVLQSGLDRVREAVDRADLAIREGDQMAAHRAAIQATVSEARAELDLASETFDIMHAVWTENPATGYPLIERASDRVAMGFRALSVFMHNQRKDYEGAAELIEFALQAVASRSLEEELLDDRVMLRARTFRSLITVVAGALNEGNTAFAAATLERAGRYADTAEQRDLLQRATERARVAAQGAAAHGAPAQDARRPEPTQAAEQTAVSARRGGVPRWVSRTMGAVRKGYSWAVVGGLSFWYIFFGGGSGGTTVAIASAIGVGLFFLPLIWTALSGAGTGRGSGPPATTARAAEPAAVPARLGAISRWLQRTSSAPWRPWFPSALGYVVGYGWGMWWRHAVPWYQGGTGRLEHWVAEVVAIVPLTLLLILLARRGWAPYRVREFGLAAGAGMLFVLFVNTMVGLFFWSLDKAPVPTVAVIGLAAGAWLVRKFVRDRRRLRAIG
jgi:hypothetical protein